MRLVRCASIYVRFSIMMLALCVVEQASANCLFLTGHGTKVITYVIPEKINVPRNAPVGTVIWSSPEKLMPGFANWSCDDWYPYGMVNAVGVGANASTPADLPIGRTGFAWNWGYSDIRFADASSHPSSEAGFPVNVGAKLRIIKIGPVESGATVPQGLLGYMSVNSQLNIFEIKTSNKATSFLVSCKTPDVTVAMGDRNFVGAFKGVGQSLTPVNFSIALKECPEGINKVSYQLNPNTTIVDATRSVVALDAASTAKGIGLQLLDGLGNPIALKTKLQYSDYDKLGGNFNIPLKAAYQQTAATLVPGTANTSVTFVMSYD